MNKRGFTLVELLAVIIILSLLALLTSTAVTKLVKDAKGDLNTTQIELIKSAAQTWGADNLTGLPSDGECSYLTLKNLKDYGLIDSNLKDPNTNEKISDDLKIKISTTKNQNSGKLITTYEVNPQSVDGCYKQIYNNGDIVYFDVTTGKSCTNYHEDNSKTGYNGINGTGDQTSCLKFYSFLDSGRKLNLLLDHNTTGTLVYSQIIDKLLSDTSSWIGTLEPSGYIGYKARLIDGQEIAKITGNNTWNELNQDSYYFFDTNTSVSTSNYNYGWLYDRTNNACKDYGCYNNSDNSLITGYATASDYCYVYFKGSLNNFSNYSEDVGVRPVIEVLKTNLQ